MNGASTPPETTAQVPTYDYPLRVSRCVPVDTGHSQLKRDLTRFHVHEGIEMCTVAAGAAVLHYGGEQHPMKQGDSAFFDSLVPHWSTRDSEEPALHVFVHMPLRVLWSVMPSPDDWRLFQPLIAVRSGRSPVLKDLPELSTDLCDIEAAMHGSKPESDLHAWARIVAALVRVAAHVLPLVATPRSAESDRARELTARAIRFIDEHYRTPGPLSAPLARYCTVSSSHLTHVFTQHMGISPVQYRTQARIAYAIQRLSSSHDKLQHIALDCGYSSLSQFRDAFKQTTGKTPGAFRGAGS